VIRVSGPRSGEGRLKWQVLDQVITMASDWHLVLNRDGAVLGTSDGAPASWVGTRLDDIHDAPEDLKEAGRAVLETARRSASPVAAPVLVSSMRRSVHLMVVDALPVRRVPTALPALLQSTLELMQRQAKAFDVTLTVGVDSDVPPAIMLDPEKIAWAVTVLVGNALRYVHRGSRLMPGGSIAVRAAYNPGGPAVLIEVQDDGSGIPGDRLRGLFAAGPGQQRVGLGLLMVREVVAAHAGRVDVQSDTDPSRRGTTVRLTLPVS
jgi:signal transduction histidine kinase